MHCRKPNALYCQLHQIRIHHHPQDYIAINACYSFSQFSCIDFEVKVLRCILFSNPAIDNK